MANGTKTEKITKADVTTVDAGEAPKKERKKRERKPIEIPDLDTLEGSEKAEFGLVLEASKSLMEAIRNAKSVKVQHLREARRALYMATGKEIKSRKGDSTARKRARLEAQILKAQKKLDELTKM